jgi:hypothetical protein
MAWIHPISKYIKALFLQLSCVPEKVDINKKYHPITGHQGPRRGVEV